MIESSVATPSAALASESSTKRIETFERLPDGQLVRSVHLRGNESTIVRTPMGWAPDSGDPRADADLAFLRSHQRPAYASGDRPLRVVDLFSGCGAMSLGVAEACRAVGRAFEPALAVDLNKTALAVYAENFGANAPAALDLSDLSSAINSGRTPLEIGLERRLGKAGVDFLVAGPPCQGHSNLNNHTRRNDRKNALYFKVARFARLFYPSVILVENVPTVLNDENDVVERTYAALGELGYKVDHSVIRVARLGVAQSRRRHMLVATRMAPADLVSAFGEVSFRDAGKAVELMLLPHEVAERPVRWAIQDLEDAVGDDLYDGLPNVAEVTKQRIAYLHENETINLPDAERPDCHRTKDHSYPSVYGRMEWEKPAPTITSGFSTMGRGRFVHPGRPRVLTAHEAARIQFMPDFFTFRSVNGRNMMTELIGNIVPPRLAYVLSLELIR